MQLYYCITCQNNSFASWFILATCWKVRKLSFVLLFSLWVFYCSLAFECFVGNVVSREP